MEILARRIYVTVDGVDGQKIIRPIVRHMTGSGTRTSWSIPGVGVFSEFDHETEIAIANGGILGRTRPEDPVPNAAIRFARAE